ncbi:MAG TPA: hypothetical protein VF718_10320 [Allosphingosinicella sp.]|jgi:hypothetical protein
MIRAAARLLLLLILSACGERAANDGLPPEARRLAAERMPTAEEIASACFMRDSDCRDDPAHSFYCEPMEDDYLARAPVCSRVRGDPSAVDCRFGATSIPWSAPPEAYRRLRPSDYRPAAARFVRVAGRTGPRWLAATYCR